MIRSWTPARKQGLRRSLLSWYDRERRLLPWRDHDDPYRVLVSEFMLQQTQVATVLPYFERFLQRFPTLESLAGADDDSVRAAWSGLGYYRRARSLHRSAKLLLSEYGGALPSDPAELRELPGVGDYTANALASIVHDRPAAVLDGNVMRVFARLLAIRDSVDKTETRRRLQEDAQALLDRSRPGDWNQAVMELGATVCTPMKPRCPECPWTRRCRAHAEGSQLSLPAKDPKKNPIAVTRAVGVFRKGSRVLLVHREDPRLLDGTWEFPGIDVTGGVEPPAALGEDLERRLRRPVTLGAELARVRHSITHRRILVRAYAIRTDPLPRSARGRRTWVGANELGDHPVSSMTTKLFKAMGRWLEAAPSPSPGRDGSRGRR